MNFSIKDFFNKCDQICRKLWIWSHLLKKSIMEKFTFYAVKIKYCISEKLTFFILFIMHNSCNKKLISKQKLISYKSHYRIRMLKPLMVRKLGKKE